MKTARIYQRVSTEEQQLERQNALVDRTRQEGYYIAGIYKEKASGARSDRPMLNNLIEDLQPGDVVIAEHIDRITRLPLPEAEKLIARIKEKGAYLSVPGIIDLSEIQTDSEIAGIVLENVQSLLLKLALQMARSDYETRRERQQQGIQIAKERGRYHGRSPNLKQHEQILALRPHHTIKKTAQLVGCSEAQVKRICALHKERMLQLQEKPTA